MGAELGVSAPSVSLAGSWAQVPNLQSLQFSRAAKFVECIVGLYLLPPEYEWYCSFGDHRIRAAAPTACLRILRVAAHVIAAATGAFNVHFR